MVKIQIDGTWQDALSLPHLRKVRPITINFNDKFEFVTETSLVKAHSATLKSMIDGDNSSDTYRVNLPKWPKQVRSLKPLIVFLKVGEFSIRQVRDRDFASLFMNAAYLQCDHVIEKLTCHFTK